MVWQYKLLWFWMVRPTATLKLFFIRTLEKNTQINGFYQHHKKKLSKRKARAKERERVFHYCILNHEVVFVHTKQNNSKESIQFNSICEWTYSKTENTAFHILESFSRGFPCAFLIRIFLFKHFDNVSASIYTKWDDIIFHCILALIFLRLYYPWKFP